MKTSITLDKNILVRIDDYRRRQKEIPTRSKAILDLILKGLKDSSVDLPKRVKEPVADKSKAVKDSVVDKPKSEASV